MEHESEALWRLPEPLSIHEVSVDDETSIVLRRHGNPEGPRLVMTHGNGLAIDLYLPFWSLLAGDFDLFVYDMRNHGWNTVSSLERHNIPTLARDHDIILDAIIRIYGEKPTIGVFHSVASLVSLLSAYRGSRYSALVLYDPTLYRAGLDFEQFEAASKAAAEGARRRTTNFRSPAQFAELLRIVPMFSRSVPGIPQLMAEATLRTSAGGQGFELRCPREYEAQLIDYARTFVVLVDFACLHCPIKVIGADPTLPYSYLPTLDLSDIMEVDYDFLPNASHFLPLEMPDECVQGLRQFLEEQKII